MVEDKDDEKDLDTKDEETDLDDKKPDDKKEKEDTVAFSTHQKLLKEKKALAAKLADIEKQSKLAKDKELKEKEEFKTLHEQAEQKAADLEVKLKEKETKLNNSVKMSAFLDALPGNLGNQYWNLVDIDAIEMDEDGKIDSVSVKKVVKDFETNYPEVIKLEDSKGLPHEAARRGKTKLTKEEWKKLPQKEKLIRSKDIVTD